MTGAESLFSTTSGKIVAVWLKQAYDDLAKSSASIIGTGPCKVYSVRRKVFINNIATELLELYLHYI